METNAIECVFKVGWLGVGAIARWVEFLSRMCKVQVPSPALQTLDMVVCTHNLGSWEAEVKGSKVHGHLQLHTVFNVSLGYMRPWLKTNKQQASKVECLGSYEAAV